MIHLIIKKSALILSDNIILSLSQNHKTRDKTNYRVNLLYIYLDSQLNFRENIDYINSKAVKTTGFLRKFTSEFKDCDVIAVATHRLYHRAYLTFKISR